MVSELLLLFFRHMVDFFFSFFVSSFRCFGGKKNLEKKKSKRVVDVTLLCVDLTTNTN